MLLTLSVIISIVAISVVVMPFFVGRGGGLEASTSENSPEKVRAIKQAILARYLEDERAFEDKVISKLVWQQRRAFLTSRYIDAARRLDYLSTLGDEQVEKGDNAKLEARRGER